MRIFSSLARKLKPRHGAHYMRKKYLPHVAGGAALLGGGVLLDRGVGAITGEDSVKYGDMESGVENIFNDEGFSILKFEQLTGEETDTSPNAMDIMLYLAVILTIVALSYPLTKGVMYIVSKMKKNKKNRKQRKMEEKQEEKDEDVHKEEYKEEKMEEPRYMTITRDMAPKEEDLELEIREKKLKMLLGEMEEKLEKEDTTDTDGYEIPNTRYEIIP